MGAAAGEVLGNTLAHALEQEAGRAYQELRGDALSPAEFAA